MNNTRKKLLSSVLSLLICCAMLVGTTFAWFTDSVTSANNKIQAGTLNVDLELLSIDDNSTWTSIKESKDPLFNYDLWEPGYAEVKVLRVSNNGTLALKWEATISKTGDLTELADVIDVYVKEDVEAYPASRNDVKAWNYAGTVAEFINNVETTTTGNLEANEQETLGIALVMREEADNTYQGLSLVANNGYLDICIKATQDTVEEDSFDETYDELAEFYTPISSYDILKSYRYSEGSYTLDEDITAAGSIASTDGGTMTLDLNGHDVDLTGSNNFGLVAQKGGNLTIDGTGEVTLDKGFFANKENATITINGGEYDFNQSGSVNVGKYYSVAQNDSKVIINDGTFTLNEENTALFYVATNAIVEVNGGFFENTADDTPDYFNLGRNAYQSTRVILKGGTFVNWNPLDDIMCYTGEWPASYEQFQGPWMLVWDGYTVVAETQANGDVWYSVVPE